MQDVPFTHFSSTDTRIKCTGAQTVRIVGPDTLHHPTKLQLYTPSQSTFMITQVNSADNSLVVLKWTHASYNIGYYKHNPLYICL